MSGNVSKIIELQAVVNSLDTSDVIPKDEFGYGGYSWDTISARQKALIELQHENERAKFRPTTSDPSTRFIY